VGHRTKISSASQLERYDEDIVFPIKTFVGTKAYVAAKGTLSADWIAYKNNTYSILCLPEECIVASVEQIGPKQVGNIEGPVAYPVKRRTTDNDVVAEDDWLCARITITLDRMTKSASAAAAMGARSGVGHATKAAQPCFGSGGGTAQLRAASYGASTTRRRTG
jgi:hypothetical protein